MPISIKSLQVELTSIKARNTKVEADKAWEVSWFRRILISILTYVFIVLFLVSFNAPNAFQSALIPAVGYFLSTLSFPLIKEWWIKKQ